MDPSTPSGRTRASPLLLLEGSRSNPGVSRSYPRRMTLSMPREIVWWWTLRGGATQTPQTVPLKTSQFYSVLRRPNIVYSNGIGAPLNTRTVCTKYLPRIEQGAKLNKENEAVNGVIQEDRSVFILGSCVWDLSSIYNSKIFDRYGSNHTFGFYELGDHLKAIRILIGGVRKSYP